MKTRVRLFAIYREKADASSIELELPDGATVERLLEALRQRLPNLPLDRERTLIAVNSQYAELSYRLMPGDEVALIPPVSGGDMLRITPDPLDAPAIADSVRRETNGAVATFEGTARRFTDGRRVLHLEYEAYPEMAEKVMAQIAEEARGRWPIDGVAIHHRVGRVEIGETSMVVAVGSPHRKEAFAALQHIVDRVKSIAPIWKKELFADGQAIWVGCEAEERTAARAHKH